MGCRLDSYARWRRSTQFGPPGLSFRNQIEQDPCKLDRSTALALRPIVSENLLSPRSLPRTGLAASDAVESTLEDESAPEAESAALESSAVDRFATLDLGA